MKKKILHMLVSLPCAAVLTHGKVLFSAHSRVQAHGKEPLPCALCQHTAKNKGWKP
jgi:hypothetical protein